MQVVQTPRPMVCGKQALFLVGIKGRKAGLQALFCVGDIEGVVGSRASCFVVIEACICVVRRTCVGNEVCIFVGKRTYPGH